MSKSSCLLKLFQDWQQAQNPSENFIPDGYLGDDEKCRILFICRESNVNGAVSECDMTALESYVRDYKDFIIKEINILNPTYIFEKGNSIINL